VKVGKVTVGRPPAESTIFTVLVKLGLLRSTWVIHRCEAVKSSQLPLRRWAKATWVVSPAHAGWTK